jgi:hypothetical protein
MPMGKSAHPSACKSSLYRRFVMVTRLVAFAAVLAMAVGPAFAVDYAGKHNTDPRAPTQTTANVPSSVRSYFEYNTGGTIDFVPELGGSATGWAEWSIAFVTNNTGFDLSLTELSWPCAGPPSGAYGWLAWPNQSTLPGAAETAPYHGAYTPVDPDPLSFPPTTYTYIDVAAQAIPWQAGTTLCFGLDNTGMQGMTAYNGVETWGWYGGIWDADSPYGRTCVLQLKADPVGIGVPTLRTTWGAIKALY